MRGRGSRQPGFLCWSLRIYSKFTRWWQRHCFPFRQANPQFIRRWETHPSTDLLCSFRLRCRGHLWRWRCHTAWGRCVVRHVAVRHVAVGCVLDRRTADHGAGTAHRGSPSLDFAGIHAIPADHSGCRTNEKPNRSFRAVGHPPSSMMRGKSTQTGQVGLPQVKRRNPTERAAHEVSGRLFA